jgi:Verrucomicrobium spinosum paralogous family TIGR02596
MHPSHGPLGRRRRAGVRARQGGFTLLELMVTLAVLAILVSLATPSFTAVINGNRLTAQANDLVADIQLARSEAVRRNRTVRLCRSEDGASCADGEGNWTGWIVMLPGADPEVLRVATVKGAVEVSGGDTMNFRPDGLARDDTGSLLATTFTVCLPTTRPAENVRQVDVAGGSRINTVVASHATPGECP